MKSAKFKQIRITFIATISINKKFFQFYRNLVNTIWKGEICMYH